MMVNMRYDILEHSKYSGRATLIRNVNTRRRGGGSFNHPLAYTVVGEMPIEDAVEIASRLNGEWISE